MHSSEFESEAGSPASAQDEGLSPTEYRKEQERLSNVQELVGVLQRFAEHFGAEEVYIQAKKIYDESASSLGDPGWDAFKPPATPRQSRPSGAERPKNTASGRKSGSRSLLEEAKRALGG